MDRRRVLGILITEEDDALISEQVAGEGQIPLPPTFAKKHPYLYQTNPLTGHFALKDKTVDTDPPEGEGSGSIDPNFCFLHGLERDAKVKVELFVDGNVVRTLRYSHRVDEKGLITLTGATKIIMPKGADVFVRVTSESGRPYFIYPGSTLTVERMREFE